MKTLLPCTASLALALGTTSQAALLVNDNFTLSTGSNVATVNNTSSSGVGTYSRIQGSGGMNVTTINDFGGGNVLALPNDTSTFYRAFDGNSSFTLNSLATGETLSLSYNVRFNTNAGSAAQNFSFGFVNTTSANSIVYANVDLYQNSVAASEFRYRSGNFNMSDAGQVVGAGFASSPLLGSTNYTFGLSVTKQSNGFLIEYLRDGSLIGSVSALSNSTWATAMGGVGITGIAFRHSQTPGLITYIDNVSVNLSAIPEPSAFAAFAGLATLGFAAGRRRRRA